MAYVVNNLSALALAQAKPFGYLVFREGQQVASGHSFADALSAELAALTAAQSYTGTGEVTFRVCYKMGFHPWRMNRDGTAVLDRSYLYPK